MLKSIEINIKKAYTDFGSDFFLHFGPNPDKKARDLKDHTSNDVSQKFVAQFYEIAQTNPDRSYEEIFKQTVSSCEDIFSSNEPHVDERHDSEPDVGKRIVWRPKKTPILSADSLRSMFDEAKEENNKK